MSRNHHTSPLVRSSPLPLLAAALLLAACEPTPPPPKHAVGGKVSGLGGTGLVLRNNGGDDLAVQGNGPFTFATPIAMGSAYSVSVAAPPSSYPQRCTVANATGTMGNSDVTNVLVVCTPVYSLGGTVTGLTGTGLVLRNNGGDDLAIAANGTFTFPTPL